MGEDSLTGAYRSFGALIDRPDRLLWHQKLCYSVGHVLNDLCASMWFTYLLLYFHFVLGFSNSMAGIVLLIGQVADALATPFVGLESDRNDDFFLCRYGRRKTWHLFGTVCVACSFPFLFSGCIGCERSSYAAQLIYYSAFVIVFQFGWASTQISHLSLIPDLTDDPNERTELNALRYAFTVVSNVCVYGITWCILGFTGDVTQSKDHQTIGPEDRSKFQNIVLIVTAIGLTQSLVFHLGVRERKVKSSVGVQNGDGAAGRSLPCILSRTPPTDLKQWRHWFTESHFYQVGFVYMFTRLFVNLAQVYIPLYLQDSLHLREDSIAIVPLVMYVAGFLSSFFMKPLNKHGGREMTYILGAIIGLSGCVWVYFGSGQNYASMQLYFVVVLIGIGGSTMLITSLSITADLIGSNTESGAFVYGAMSFTDKLSNGLAIVLIQNFHPCQTCCHECSHYYQLVLSCGCGGAAIAAIVALVTLLPRKWKNSKSEGTNLINANDNGSRNLGYNSIST